MRLPVLHIFIFCSCMPVNDGIKKAGLGVEKKTESKKVECTCPLQNNVEKPASINKLSSVYIHTKTKKGTLGAWGGGTIVSGDGLILTAGHIINPPFSKKRNAEKAFAVVDTGTKSIEFEAAIKKIYKEYDLALLKIDYKTSSWAKLRTEPLNARESVVGIFYVPLDGIFDNRFPLQSKGFYSRPFYMRPWKRTLELLYLPAIGGCSGGPIFDTNGELVGIVEGTVELSGKHRKSSEYIFTVSATSFHIHDVLKEFQKSE